jgi:hypothetical protein
VALDLPGHVVRDEVDRVLDVLGCVLGTQRRALDLELGRRRVADPGELLLAQLHVQHRQLGHLLADLLESPRHALAQLVGDLKVASLDLDPHGTPLLQGATARMVRVRPTCHGILKRRLSAADL